MLEDASALMIVFHLRFVYTTSNSQMLNTYFVLGIMLDMRDKDEHDITASSQEPKAMRMADDKY